MCIITKGCFCDSCHILVASISFDFHCHQTLNSLVLSSHLYKTRYRSFHQVWLCETFLQLCRDVFSNSIHFVLTIFFCIFDVFPTILFHFIRFYSFMVVFYASNDRKSPKTVLRANFHTFSFLYIFLNWKKFTQQMLIIMYPKTSFRREKLTIQNVNEEYDLLLFQWPQPNHTLSHVIQSHWALIQFHSLFVYLFRSIRMHSDCLPPEPMTGAISTSQSWHSQFNWLQRLCFH